MSEFRLCLPLTKEAVQNLKAGDRVLLSGPVLTGRDAAHRRLFDALTRGQSPAVPLEGETIYYVGPCPAPPGRPVGSCGPTTSMRMDLLTPRLLEAGLRGMIGKGNRSPEVVAAMKKYGCVYFAAVGGAGALCADRVTACSVLAFEDLGTEAVHRMILKDFPVLVAIDCRGNSVYHEGRPAQKGTAQTNQLSNTGKRDL